MDMYSWRGISKRSNRYCPCHQDIYIHQFKSILFAEFAILAGNALNDSAWQSGAYKTYDMQITRKKC